VHPARKYDYARQYALVILRKIDWGGEDIEFGMWTKLWAKNEYGSLACY
jgi:hypothetical protein